MRQRPICEIVKSVFIVRPFAAHYNAPAALIFVARAVFVVATLFDPVIDAVKPFVIRYMVSALFHSFLLSPKWAAHSLGFCHSVKYEVYTHA